jgi:RHS repeat-associated protein
LRWSRPAAPLILAALLGVAAPALVRADDKSGVAPGKIKLPQGPGSLEGIGENAEPNLSMGLLQYGVPITLPQGYAGLTPGLRLAYSSGGGASVAGIGWSLEVASVERMTSRGLPRYGATDAFVANGGEELVNLPGTTTYRARYEGGFIRYTWVNPGAEGYWKAEYPDGRVAWFGADSQGTLADGARVRGPDGTFRYHVVEVADPYDHRIRYYYRKDGSASLLERVAWVFSGTTPRYQVTLDYETRADEISDAKPGFDVRLTQRLTSLTVLTRGELVRSYELTYEPDATSGGLSRLASVTQYGTAPGQPYPARFLFHYTGLGDTRTAGLACREPCIVDMAGSVGPGLNLGNADLVDMNGDGLPDVVDTTGGDNRVYFNQLPGDGTPHGFAVASGVIGVSAELAAPKVDLVDLDGDGFADLVDSDNHRVLWNRGTGTWAAQANVNVNLPTIGGGSLYRFFDYDHDKASDLIYSDGTTTGYLRNLGGGTFSTTMEFGDAAGGQYQTVLPSFAAGLQLADMNGDGMLDAVLPTTDGVSYWLYLGRGRFSRDPIEMTGLPASRMAALKLIDLNGDGLADAVFVLPGEVSYALNRNGRTFDPLVSVTTVKGVAVPNDPGLKVRLADMNGNGSTDVVWIDGSGQLTYLDLFPVRPNLMRRVDNSIGKVIEATYGAAVEHMARDGGPGAWSDRLPNPMLTLDRIVTYDTLTGVPQSRELRYHDGYYDGAEKQFRGFARVEVVTAGDSTAEDGVSSSTFDVGKTDRYRKGLLVETSAYSGSRLIATQRHTYADCTLTGVPSGLPVAVRHVCQTATEKESREGLGPEAAVVTREEYRYDGYGNRVATTSLGVVGVGGGGCAPCARAADAMGAPCDTDCRGDERYEEADYVPPEATGGRWLLSRVCRTRSFGRPGSAVAQQVTYYDGDALVGLPACQLTTGAVARVSARLDATTWIDTHRYRNDAHGNVIEEVDANGHSRAYAYDDDGVQVTGEEILFTDAGHAPYGLSMQVTYDPVLEVVLEATDWARTEGGAVVSTPHVTRYAYDAFGRLSAVARPGDSLDQPTESYRYDLADPVSRIVKRTRSRAGGAEDLEEVQCFDGTGRRLQTRTLVAAGSYQVSGFTLHNTLSKERRTYQPYLGGSADCDTAAPAGVLATDRRFDGLGRTLEVVRPDGALYASPSRVTYAYEPLASRVLDQEDSDPASPHANTPTVTRHDGLGRTVAVERGVGGGQPETKTFTYDELGHFRGFRDDAGNERVQTRDLLGRIVRVTDPDTGTLELGYDAAGNRVSERDARGVTRRYAFDEVNRLAADWDDADPAGSRIGYVYDRLDGCGDASCANAEGRLARVSYPAGWDQMGYDARGRAVSFTRSVDGHTLAFQTEYDNAGRIAAHRVPGGREVRQVLDGAGRLAGVPGYIQSVAYEARGKLTSLAFANGVASTSSYDAIMRVAASETRGGDGALLQSYAYTRDRVGNVTGILDGRPADGAPTATAEYAYDDLYRLTQAHLDPGDPAHEELLTYAYDRTDNLVTKVSSRGAASPEHVGTLRYGGTAGPHAVTRAGDRTVLYDAAGQATLNGTDRHSWDHLGRLVEVRRDARVLTRSVYGAGTTRVKKVENGHTTYYFSPDYEVRDGASVYYLRLGRHRVAKIESEDLAASFLPDLAPARLEGGRVTPAPDGQIRAADAWVALAAANGVLDAPGAKGADVEALLSAAARRTLLGGKAEETTFLHQDHLGSQALATDEAGAVRWRTQHHPYGAVRSETGLDDYGFTGAERDDGAGLLNFGARALDARAGRWLSADPLFGVIEDFASVDWRQANQYAYAVDNPVNFIDEDGRAAKEGAVGHGVAGDPKNGLYIQADALYARAEGEAKVKLEKGMVSAGVKVDLRASMAHAKTGYTKKGVGEVYAEGSTFTGRALGELRVGASKELVGAQAKGELKASLLEGAVKGKLEIPVPFTSYSLELGGKAEGHLVGIGVGGEVKAGAFKEEDGRWRTGIEAGGKLIALIGGGVKLSISVGERSVPAAPAAAAPAAAAPAAWPPPSRSGSTSIRSTMGCHGN